MSQGNLDSRIKKVFESLDEFDQKEALTRKEDVWQRTHSYKDRKRRRKWLFVLLLGALFFAAGWFSKHMQSVESNPTKRQDKIQSTQTNQYAITIEKKKQIMVKQELDSLINVNRILSAELVALNEKYASIQIPETSNNISYIRDTLYVTEVKIQEKIIERIIKDTIVIEVPTEQEIHLAIASNDISEAKKNDEDVVSENPNKRPTSVQFNFREINPTDK